MKMGNECGTSKSVKGRKDRNVLSVTMSETGYQRVHVCVCYFSMVIAMALSPFE